MSQFDRDRVARLPVLLPVICYQPEKGKSSLSPLSRLSPVTTFITPIRKMSSGASINGLDSDDDGGSENAPSPSSSSSEEDEQNFVSNLSVKMGLYRRDESGAVVTYDDGKPIPSEGFRRENSMVSKDVVDFVAEKIMKLDSEHIDILAKCDSLILDKLFPQGKNKFDATDETDVTKLTFMMQRFFVLVNQTTVYEMQFDPQNIHKKIGFKKYTNKADFQKRFAIPIGTAKISVPDKKSPISLAEWYLDYSGFALTRERAAKMENDSREVLSLFLGMNIDGSLAEYDEHDQRIRELMYEDESNPGELKVDHGKIFDLIESLVNKNIESGKDLNEGLSHLEQIFFLEYVHSSKNKESFVHMCSLLCLKYNDPFLFLAIFIWLSGKKGMGKGLMIDFQSFIFGCAKFGQVGEGINAVNCETLSELVGGGAGSVGDNALEQGKLLLTCEEADIPDSDKRWDEHGTLHTRAKLMTTNQENTVRRKNKDREHAERRVAMVMLCTNNMKILSKLDSEYPQSSRRNWNRILVWDDLCDTSKKYTQSQKERMWLRIALAICGERAQKGLTQAAKDAANDLRFRTAHKYVHVIKSGVIAEGFNIKHFPRSEVGVEDEEDMRDRKWSELPLLLQFLVSDVVPEVERLAPEKQLTVTKKALCERYKKFVTDNVVNHRKNKHWQSIDNKEKEPGGKLGLVMDSIIKEVFKTQKERNSIYELDRTNKERKIHFNSDLRTALALHPRIRACEPWIWERDNLQSRLCVSE